MSLLGLPTELLDQIFGYLDWDRNVSLCPIKDDIVNGSRTCKQLREVLAPLVFRDVVLQLCWAGGRLIEPGLLKLRRQCPKLARHIRCVYIRTDFHYWSSTRNDKPTWIPFRPPTDIRDWLNPSGDDCSEPTDRLTSYRSEADAAARQLCGTAECPPEHDSLQEASAEAIIHALLPRAKESEREKLLALSIVMLCIPFTTENLIFKALSEGDVTDTKPRFALCVAATAFDLFSEHLTSIRMITNDALRSMGVFWRQQQSEDSGGIYGTSYVTAQSIANLRIQRLALASGESPVRSAIFPRQGFERWHGARTITELDLRFISAHAADFVTFIQGFSSLKALRLRSIVLTTPHNIGVRVNLDVERRVWLRFLIDLRQAMPNIELDIHTIYSESNRTGRIPKCEANWLLETVPRGQPIDADREERLIQDYMSFLPLWEAEDSSRGSAAMEDWQKNRGTLSDAAMSRRWR